MKSVEAFLGTCVHTALEALYEGARQARVMTLEETVAVFDEAWNAGWSEAVEIRKKEYSAEDWKRVGRECVATYYRLHAPFDGDRTVEVEKRIGFPLDAGGETYRIEGFIDRLALGKDGAFEIHDYKTGKTLPSQQDVDADTQLAIYELAVRFAWPDTKVVRLVWHYVRHGKALVSTRSAEQRAALKAEIARLIEAIKHDHEFAPRRSALCDWCEYRDLCPLFAHAEKVAQMTFAELQRDDGVKLVDRLAGIDARKKELKVRLKELEVDQKAVEAAVIDFARKQGVAAVAGLDGTAVVVEKEEVKFPTKTHAPEALEELELELKASPIWAEVSHLDPHRLMEGYKRKDWAAPVIALVESLLGRFAKRVKETHVRFHRKKDMEE